MSQTLLKVPDATEVVNGGTDGIAAVIMDLARQVKVVAGEIMIVLKV